MGKLLAHEPVTKHLPNGSYLFISQVLLSVTVSLSQVTALSSAECNNNNNKALISQMP